MNNKFDLSTSLSEHNIFTFDKNGKIEFDENDIDFSKISFSELSTGSSSESKKSKSITVDNVTDYLPSSKINIFGKIYRFGPEGTKFNKPANLTIPYEYREGMAEDVVDVYYYNKEDKTWEILHKVSQDKEAKTVTVKIDHFSDYAAGTGSYKVDEGGTFSNISASGNIDPYTGTLTFARSDLSISARGLGLSLSSSFSSDYAYAAILPEATQISEDFDENVLCAAGITTVTKPNNNFYPLAKGWSWDLPYVEFVEDHVYNEPSRDKNKLCVYTSRGRKYDFKSALQSCGDTKWIEGYHIDWNGGKSNLTIQLPESKMTIKVNGEIRGWFKHFHVKKVDIYPGDGRKISFDDSKKIKAISDYSGKNTLTFSYSGDNISKISHTDGRCVKFYYYAITGGNAIVTVLSSDPDKTKFKVGDKFLNKYTINSSGWLTKFEALKTEPMATDTTVASFTSANEDMFSIMQTVEYTYNLDSTLVNNYIEIKNPAESTIKYIFEKQKAFCHIYKAAGSVQVEVPNNPSGTPTTTYNYTKYIEYRLNKPRVTRQEIRHADTDTTYKLSKYDYTFNSACDSSDFSELGYSVTGNIQDNNVDVKLSQTHLLNTSSTIYSSKHNGTAEEFYTKSTINYEHDSNDNRSLKGQSSTISFRNVGPLTTPDWISDGSQVSKSTNSFSLLANVDGMYLTDESKSFILSQTEEKTKANYYYDGYGRVTKEEAFYRNDANELVTNGKKYYHLIDNTYHSEAGDLLADNDYASNNKSKYEGRGFFSLTSGILTEMKPGVYHKVYTKYDSNLNVVALKNIEYSALDGSMSDAETVLTYDPNTNTLIGMTYPDGKSLAIKYGTGWKSSFIVADEKVMEANIDGKTQVFKNTFDYDIKGRLTTKENKMTDPAGIVWDEILTIKATDIIAGNNYKIATSGDTVYTAIGADDNNVGTIFTAIASGTGTGTVYKFQYPTVSFSYEYDDMNRMTLKKIGTNSVLKYEYDDVGKKVTKTDHLGFKSISFYDNLYRVKEVKSYKPKSNTYKNIDVTVNDSNLIAWAQSNHDLVYGVVDSVKVTDPTYTTYNDVSKYIANHNVFDIMGRTTDTYIKAKDSTWKIGDVTPPAIQTSQITYDEENNVVKNKVWFNASDWTESYARKDWLGRTVETRSYEQKNSTSNHLTGTTYYDYVGNVTSTVLPNGDEYKFFYSTAGKLEKMEYPEGTCEVKTYDINGNTKTVTDRGGVKTTFYYNSSNVPYKQETFIEGEPAITVETTFCHLGAVLVTQKENEDIVSQTEYVYDACGGPATIKQIVDGQARTISYTYDAIGVPLTMTVTGAGGFTKTIEMDAQYHPIEGDIDNHNTTTISSGGTTLIKSKGRFDGTIDSIEYGSGKTTTYAYDNLLRLSGITNQGEDPFIYERDLSGNITKIGSTNYTYDALGRLTSDGVETSITFDNINNLLTRETDTVRKEYTYLPTNKENKTNQMKLIKFEEKEILPPNKIVKSWSLNYDARGNLIDIKDRFDELKYDALGRLRSIKYQKK